MSKFLEALRFIMHTRVLLLRNLCLILVPAINFLYNSQVQFVQALEAEGERQRQRLRPVSVSGKKGFTIACHRGSCWGFFVLFCLRIFRHLCMKTHTFDSKVSEEGLQGQLVAVIHIAPCLRYLVKFSRKEEVKIERTRQLRQLIAGARENLKMEFP